MCLNTYLSKIETGAKANFTLFGAGFYKNPLGEMTISKAREIAKKQAGETKKLKLVVNTPHWGGVQVDII